MGGTPPGNASVRAPAKPSTRAVADPKSTTGSGRGKVVPANFRVNFGGGYGNLQNMSQEAGLVGLENFVLPVASVLACGAWLLRHRRTDPWILLGVCALAARLGWYHRFYDDMLLVFPVIALVRIFASGSEPGGADPRTSRTAAVLLALTLAHLLAPGRIHLHMGALMDAAAAWIWLADLVFLAAVIPPFAAAGAGLEPARRPLLPCAVSAGAP